jgi:glycosidase
MGDAVKTFAVMTFTIPGMPLVYTGQEVGFNKRLAFFTKDAVNYNKTNFSDFYRKLITLKKEHRVLWNGSEGGDMMIIESGDNNIFIFKRSNESEEILLVFNLSAGQKQLIVTNSMAGDYIEYFSKEEIDLKVKNKINLSGWDYKILVHKK